jgi:hypothetical protein
MLFHSIRTYIQAVTLSVAATAAYAQDSPALYPQGYFRNPLDIPILLAGNFGECRPNHFHSGMDIKTNGKENLAVYAAADGYISRIKIERGGFGHALYVTHPNGFTTLYAHLNDFSPKLQQYLRSTQYQKESWAADIPLKPEQFPVKQREQIAWSGNTGGSTAPHLHFEIRNSQTEHPLNPQLFGFEINDTRPPVPLRLAVYDINTGVYEQTPQIITLKKTADGYGIAGDTLFLKTTLAGIGIEVNDYMNGSDNTLNFYTAEWYMYDIGAGIIRLDDIGYEETRYLHAYADYKMHTEKGQWYQLLFKMPGNKLPLFKMGDDKPKVYNIEDGAGFIRLNDAAPHNIKVVMTDASGNATIVSFYVRSTDAAKSPQLKGPSHYGTLFTVGKVNIFEHPNIKFTLPATALYESLYFNLKQTTGIGGFTSRYQVHNPNVPVHNYFDLYLKPEVPVPFALRNKLVMMYTDGKTTNGRGTTSEDSWYKGSVRNFGTYWLAADTVAPVIKIAAKEGAVLTASKSLTLTVTEKLTSVKTFRAELDGRWLLFEPTGTTYTYLFDSHCPKGRHELVVTAADENGNSSRLVYHFMR